MELERTESGIEHVERHLVSLLRAGNGDKPLVGVVLGFVDLDRTTTELADLIDLGSTFTNDGTNHVVRDEDLLKNLAGHALDRLRRTTLLRNLRTNSDMRGIEPRTHCLLGLVSRGEGLATASRRAGPILHSLLGVWLLGELRIRVVHIGHSIRIGRTADSLVSVLAVLLGMRPMSTNGLRLIWLDYHAAWDKVRLITTTRSVVRRSWPTVFLSQLFDQGLGNIIDSNVDRVCNTHDDQGALSALRKVAIGRIKTSVRSLLNLANALTIPPDDSTDENIGNEQAHWIRPRLGSGGLVKLLVVKCADNKTEGLKQ